MALSAAAMVTLIDESIEALVTGKEKQVTHKDRIYTFYDLKELRELREYYAGQVRLEDSSDPRSLRISPIHLGGTVTRAGQD